MYRYRVLALFKSRDITAKRHDERVDSVLSLPGHHVRCRALYHRLGCCVRHRSRRHLNRPSASMVAC